MAQVMQPGIPDPFQDVFAGHIREGSQVLVYRSTLFASSESPWPHVAGPHRAWAPRPTPVTAPH